MSQAQSYRAKAAECRQLAETAPDPQIRESKQREAESWALLAQLLEGFGPPAAGVGS
jgi:hypothetical protein